MAPDNASTTFGQTVTFTATVNPSLATGTVQFKDGATNLGSAVTLTNGIATLSISTLAIGTHSISATYSGDVNYAGGTSPAISQLVVQAPTTTALVSSTLAMTYGQTVTFSATVSPSATTGTVQFRDGATNLGSAVTLTNGIATLSASTLSAGTHSITAVYSGDVTYAGSSSAINTVNVNAAPLAITPAGGKSKVYGQTFTALTGTVVGLQGSDAVAVTYGSGGAAAAAPVGSYDITVVSYTFTIGSASNYSISAGTATNGLTVSQATPTLPAAQSGSSTYGVPAVLSVTISPVSGGATPQGSVTFQFTLNSTTYNICSDGTLQRQPPAAPATPCTVPLNNAGTASVTTPNLPAGADNITASYSGDTNYAGGEQTTLNFSISQANSQITMAIAPNSPTPTYGDQLTLRATVSDNTTNSTGMPTGTVQFAYSTDSGAHWTNIGSPVALSSGQGEIQTTTLPAGTPMVRAGYSGDSNFGTSSISSTQAVNQKSLTVSGVTASDKPYDGTMSASLNTGTAALVGLVNGDPVTLNTNGATGAFADANVGTSKRVAISGLTISGTGAGNYRLAQPASTASISPAPLTGTVTGTQVYGGSGRTFTVSSYSGFVNGEGSGVVSGTLTCTTTAGSASAVGSRYTISNCSGLTATNYSITYSYGAFSVTPAPLTVTAAGTQAYGGTSKSFTPTYSAFVGSDTASVVTGTLTCATTAGPTSPVGSSYTISNCSGLTATNYAVTYSYGTFSVTVAPLTVTVTGTQVYGGTSKSFSPGYSAFVGSDTASVVSGTLTCTTITGPTSPVGSSYTISNCLGLAATNSLLSKLAK